MRHPIIINEMMISNTPKLIKNALMFMLSKTIDDSNKKRLVQINIYFYLNVLYLSALGLSYPLSDTCLSRSFPFLFPFLLTFALRTKSMALRATVLALVLIKVTGTVVCTSPTLCLIHITFQPFLSPPSFFRFQQ